MDDLSGRKSLFLVAYIGVKDDHRALYIPHQGEEGPGRLFHVVGSLINGMVFQTKDTRDPRLSLMFRSMSRLGWVIGGDEKVQQICERIPPPPKQYDLGQRLVPLSEIRHCQHWAREACEELQLQGVLEPLQSAEKPVEKPIEPKAGIEAEKPLENSVETKPATER